MTIEKIEIRGGLLGLMRGSGKPQILPSGSVVHLGGEEGQELMVRNSSMVEIRTPVAHHPDGDTFRVEPVRGRQINRLGIRTSEDGRQFQIRWSSDSRL